MSTTYPGAPAPRDAPATRHLLAPLTSSLFPSVNRPTERRAQQQPKPVQAVDRLPLEVLGEIFAICLRDDACPRSFPFNAAAVSRLWQFAAVSTPELWTRVCIPWTVLGIQRGALSIELSRALPIDIQIELAPAAAPLVVLRHIATSMHRWRSVRFIASDSVEKLMRFVLPECKGPTPLLETLEFRSKSQTPFPDDEEPASAEELAMIAAQAFPFTPRLKTLMVDSLFLPNLSMLPGLRNLALRVYGLMSVDSLSSLYDRFRPCTSLERLDLAVPLGLDNTCVPSNPLYLPSLVELRISGFGQTLPPLFVGARFPSLRQVQLSDIMAPNAVPDALHALAASSASTGAKIQLLELRRVVVRPAPFLKALDELEHVRVLRVCDDPGRWGVVEALLKQNGPPRIPTVQLDRPELARRFATVFGAKYKASVSNRTPGARVVSSTL